MTVILLEGITAAGKTAVFKQIQALLTEKKPNFSKFYISEHLSQRLLAHVVDPSTKQKMAEDHLTMLMNFIKYLAAMHQQSVFGQRQQPIVFIVIERCFLSHLCDHTVSLDFVLHLLHSLAGIHFQQYLLTVPEN